MTTIDTIIKPGDLVKFKARFRFGGEVDGVGIAVRRRTFNDDSRRVTGWEVFYSGKLYFCDEPYWTLEHVAKGDDDD